MDQEETIAQDATLYERLCSFENLLYAYRDAARGKRNRPDVAAFAGRIG